MKILVIGDFHKKFSQKLKNKILKQDFDVIIGVGDYTGIPMWRPLIKKNMHLIRQGKKPISLDEFYGKEGKKKLLKEDEETAMQVLKTLNSFEKPVYFIFGNGDDDWYDFPFDTSIFKPVTKKRINFLNKMKNLKEMTYKIKRFRKINLIGFGGYMDIDLYLDKKYYKNDKKTNERIKRRRKMQMKLNNMLNKTQGHIFVFHYPPKGYFDKINEKGNVNNGKSAGIGFFTDAIKKYKPSLVLFGHMHEYQGSKKLGNSVLVNPGAAEKGRFAIIDFDEKQKKVKKIKFIK